MRWLRLARVGGIVVLVATVALYSFGQIPKSAEELTRPIVLEEVVFEEVEGVVAVEAEHFFRQTLTEKRAWYLTTAQHTPGVEPDGDEPHVAGASGGAYLEILPDTRRTHDDKLVRGENISHTPGEMAVLHYKVHFNTTGRYYVWARTYSTNGEDNGLHVGIDGQWPESGQRMQWTAKNRWFWDSKQRTPELHAGERYKLYLDVERAGEHVVMFSMREDGFEFDKWLMTTDREFARPEDPGPAPRLKRGALPPPFASPAEDAAGETTQPAGR